MEKLIKECRGCASEEITREYKCTCVYETVPQTMKKTKTRGYALFEFHDTHGNKCSFQESSSVEPHIWLGISGSRMHLNVEQVRQLLPLLQEFVEKTN